MRLLIKIHNKKDRAVRNCLGQATSELAIMGAVVMMLLAYLVQQGYLYNARQGLEMYTFREALRQSQSQERGVTLTVLRDVISPSLFSSINKQRLMASASVDSNPWIMWKPNKPEDVASRQLLQIGEGMIRNGRFIEVPPTRMKIVTNESDDQEEEDQWQWSSSSTRQIGVQPSKVSSYDYITKIDQTPNTKAVEKDLASQDTVGAPMIFENKGRIESEIVEDDWTTAGDDDHIKEVNVEGGTIPTNINLILDETVYKGKVTTTPH